MDEALLQPKDEGKLHSDSELVAAAAKELGYSVSVAMLEQAIANNCP